jgi:cytochrome c
VFSNINRLIVMQIVKYGIRILMLCCGVLWTSCQDSSTRILVFTKTEGYYHESIPSGIQAIQSLGKQHGFNVDTTRDAAFFTDKTLKKYNAVIFLSTTGNVLNPDQQVAFERYIQAGGGFVGIHAAADTEYDWPWYNQLVGAYFLNHPNDPNVRDAIIKVVDSFHIATRHLPSRWQRKDEWYNYKGIYSGIKPILQLDEDSYDGGLHGDNHPIAWYHNYDGGRAFYTGGGHTNESFSEPLFLKHILGGIQFAIGDGTPLDYTKAYAVKTPEENRFVKTILSDDLNEPMELAVADDGRVFFIERSGKLAVYLPDVNETRVVYTFDVLPDTKEGFGNGLLGLTLDPSFHENKFLYVFYTPNSLPAHQRVSRFSVGEDNMLDVSSEKIIIEIPIDIEVSAHTGGSLAWDSKGNLFISTGDNTVPFASGGYAPIDERAGRLTFDAQRSSANTNDLRGKILRITPKADGTYSIPDGNLFPVGTPLTRPEIYAMGCRNPYRISVDQATDILYWGEIGPDAGADGAQGPRGYDEINQAKKPGFFGWPYFIGDNIPYHRYNFSTLEIGAQFDAKNNTNNSINNTGIRNLPGPEKAMIWYPYGNAENFPSIGNGGRSAMAGPVYHVDKNRSHPSKLPAYYDGGLFIYEWMRNTVFVVRFDEQMNFKRMEPFMATVGDFKRPIDLEISRDGILYMLEYGSVYGIDNDDARLVRIDYNEGNRKPKAVAEASTRFGISPLVVNFSAQKSFDDDGDALKYMWRIDSTMYHQKLVSHTFNKNGLAMVILTVEDALGEKDSDTLFVNVGNTEPILKISSDMNTTFYFPNKPFRYDVSIQDAEDTVIDQQRAMVSFHFVPKKAQKDGHQVVTMPAGKILMEGSDCKACHQIKGKSVGPSFTEVAARYGKEKNAIHYLANKIIVGGSGVWGEHGMNAHPQLSINDAEEIVRYILALNETNTVKSLPLSGSVVFSKHPANDYTGHYVLQASYEDSGAKGVPLKGNVSLSLRSARVMANNADAYRDVNWIETAIGGIHHNSYFMLKAVDLKGINKITYRYSSITSGVIEVRAKSARGAVLSTFNFPSTGDWNHYKEITVPLSSVQEKSDLYFVFLKEGARDLCNVQWVEFMQ